mgnify:CR=1 FL=1
MDRIARSFRLKEPSPFGASRKDSLTLLRSGPDSLDPHVIGDAASKFYAVQIFGGLVALDQDLSVTGDLADNWDITGDGTEYIFHLRQGTVFHSGKRVTAQDVKYSLERVADPGIGSRGGAALYLDDIAGFTERRAGMANQVVGVEIIDEYTVRISLGIRCHTS